MAFKVVISDPKSRRSFQKEVEEHFLIGKKIGDRIKGDFLGMEGYELEITGGSDKQGFPMRPDIHGTVRKKVLLSFPPGFHPKKKGQRKKKSVRGNTISSEIAQVNTKIVTYGKKSVEEIFGVKLKEEKTKEQKAEEKAKPEHEEKQEEPKTEKAEEKEHKPEET